MMERANADEKVQAGWLRIWVVFEVLAGKEEKAKEALEDLMKKLDEDKRVKMYKKEYSDIKRIETPTPKIKEAFSLTCESELIAPNFDNVVQIVMEYGPSAIEILEPNKLQLGVGEAQTVLNVISQMMHKFAAAGAGGIVIAGKQE